MRIVSVELRNIKSYGDPACSIQFRPGVNLIWGENGSGKTTILEAIGFALFGALELDLKQFRRKGENEGEVILTLEGTDERCYRVIRKIRASADLEIRDLETNLKISKTREDAQKWLSQAIGVEFAGFGKTLFENVLGVSQGRMVESFLQTAGVRRGIFEPILKLEGYEQTWEYLGKAQTDLAGRVTAAKTKAARLEGQLDPLPGLKEEIEGLQKQIREDEEAYEQLCSALQDQESALDVLEQQRKSLEQLDTQIALALGTVESGKKALETAEAERNQSAEAARVLEECQDGFQSYQKATADLARFDLQRAEREKLNRELQEIEKRRAKLSVQLAGIEDQLDDVAVAERKITELEPLAQQQRKLEKSVTEKQQETEKRQQALEAQARLAIEQQMLETQLQQIQSGLARRGEVATELQKKQSDLGQLLPILERLSREAAGMQQELHQANQELHQLEMKIQALEFLKKQQAEKTSELERHRQERKKIQEEMLERTRVLETIENENRVIEEEQGRLARAQSDQKTAEREIAQLEERRALLHQVETAECPVCKKPLEAHEAADIEAEFEREITGQQERLLSAKSVEKEAKKSADDHKSVLISLNQKLMKLATPENQQQIEAKIAQLDDELQKLQQEIDVEGTLPGQIAGKKDQVEEIRKKISSLETTQGERIQEREGLDREIALLNNELQNLPQPGQAEHLQKAIEECIREAAEQGKLVGLLQSAPEALRKAQEELVQLGNPIGLQAEQRGIANQRPALEKNRSDLHGLFQSQEPLRNTLLEDLQAYAGLDALIKQASAHSEEHKPRYIRYLENQQAAAALQQRQEKLSSLLDAQQAAENKLQGLQDKLREGKAAFDEVQHRTLLEAVREKHQRRISIETRVKLQKEQAETKQKQLENLLQTQVEFDTTQKEVARLEKLSKTLAFVRDSIRKAGPQIARRRVQAVSYGANRIFRQILLSTSSDGGANGGSDPGTLNWDNTYEVTVRRSGDDLVFKQLSGGEKMAAAIAIRIALLSQMTSNLRLLFLDEPTANMDDARRNQLAEQITRLEGLNQLFVITHDDAFERSAHHVLQVFKHNDVSTVDIKS